MILASNEKEKYAGPKYKGMKETKEIIAFHIGVLYGFLKTRISLLRKENK